MSMKVEKSIMLSLLKVAEMSLQNKFTEKNT